MGFAGRQKDGGHRFADRSVEGDGERLSGRLAVTAFAFQKSGTALSLKRLSGRFLGVYEEPIRALHA